MATRGIGDNNCTEAEPRCQYCSDGCAVLHRLNGSSLLSIWGGDHTILDVTVRQLMAMQSGINDYDDKAYEAFTFANPNSACAHACCVLTVHSQLPVSSQSPVSEQSVTSLSPVIHLSLNSQ